MKILRLLITENCTRNCTGCCNKQWDLSKLPVEYDYQQYDQILLTGGEPMLNPNDTLDVIDMLREEFKFRGKIYMYTADVHDLDQTYKVLMKLDGITVTLHDNSDVRPFINFQNYVSDIIRNRMIDQYSFRLNIFNDVSIYLYDMLNKRYLTEKRIPWKIKDGIVWINPCSLPDNEVFKRFS